MAFMGAPILKCKHCGETFSPTREEMELHADGYTPLPNECEECFAMYNNNEPEYESRSDADSGL